MDLKSMLLMTGAGFVLGAISRRIAAWWAGERDAIKAGLQHADDALEERLGVKLPPGFHAFYDGLVAQAVTFVDGYASSPSFIRTVIRAVINKDTSKWEQLKAFLGSCDWAGNIAAQVPEELKPIFNQAKEDLAFTTVKAKLVQVLPESKQPSEQAVRESIQVSVATNKVVDKPKVITNELLERLIKESEARQAKLAK